jgi:hypothetical protein
MSGWGAAAGTNLANPDTERSVGLGGVAPSPACPAPRPRPASGSGPAAPPASLRCSEGSIAAQVPPGCAPGAAGRHGGGPAGGIIVSARNIDGPGAGLADRWGTFPSPCYLFLFEVGVEPQRPRCDAKMVLALGRRLEGSSFGNRTPTCVPPVVRPVGNSIALLATLPSCAQLRREATRRPGGRTGPKTYRWAGPLYAGSSGRG